MFTREILITKIEILRDYLKEAPDYMIKLYYETLTYEHFILIQGLDYLSIYAYPTFGSEGEKIWKIRIIYDREFLDYQNISEYEEIPEEKFGIMPTEEILDFEVDEEIGRLLDSIVDLIKKRYASLIRK